VILLYPGRIAWGVAPGDRGEGKTRPMIIATRRTDIVRGLPIQAVVCSTQFADPPRVHEILLPWDQDGKCPSRLRSAAVAVCDWVVELPRDAEMEAGGFIGGQLLRDILTAAGLPHVPER
jgi:hypothetical protein